MSNEDKETLIEKKILGSVYYKTSEEFMRGLYPIARTVKAEQHDLAVVEMQKKRLGNIYGFDGGNYAGNVYDDEMLSPTIRAYQGRNQQPMIIDSPKCLNSKGGRNGIDGLQPSVQDRVYDTDGIITSITTSYMPGILEKQIVAMRGRNPDNPSDRTAGSPTEQRLEPNSQGICNTLTSVQKDNMVLEPRLVGGIGEKWGDKQYRQGNRVYDSDSVAMALTSQPLGNAGGNSYMYLVRKPTYRIRKLTPLECWRLMGFSDEDFHKAEEVNSNTQLYKQAGNSIVKNVLMAIFWKMIPGKENLYKEL